MTELSTSEYVFRGFSRPSVSADVLAERLERREGVRLPSRYRLALPTIDGRSPRQRRIVVENAFGDETTLSVNTFLTLVEESDTEDPDLREILASYSVAALLPVARLNAEGCLPFALDRDGSFYCFDYGLAEKGKVPVVYLDAKDEMQKWELCDDFEEFLDILE